ncbi:MAG TPA: ATP-binding cassette domain-containing protein [Candidatus Krumholzibacteria bacterium]|nr:ATP-binding cassette domain-containing protein [Candidatus Krumholzibacteria bacterium]
MRSDPELLLQLRAVEVAYDAGLPEKNLALRGVSFDLHHADRLGLMGRAGSGKTTLLHVCARLVEANAGSVHAPQQREPSLVFQFPEHQLFAETVAEDVGYGLRQGGVAPGEIRTRVEQALEDVGLAAAEFAARPPFHLSGGEKRRVALAGALAQQRGLVLLDEPTLGLDAEGIERLRAILERMHARGVAYCVASHDADFVAATCTRLVVLDAGRVVFQGPTEEFWGDPQLVETCGVRLPRTAALAQTLRGYGVLGLPPQPDLRRIAAALLALWHRPGAHS